LSVSGGVRHGKIKQQRVLARGGSQAREMTLPEVRRARTRAKGRGNAFSSMPIDEMTPLEAIGKLYELQQRARQNG
jgi:hypothetical protein